MGVRRAYKYVGCYFRSSVRNANVYKYILCRYIHTVYTAQTEKTENHWNTMSKSKRVLVHSGFGYVLMFRMGVEWKPNDRWIYGGVVWKNSHNTYNNNNSKDHRRIGKCKNVSSIQSEFCYLDIMRELRELVAVKFCSSQAYIEQESSPTFAVTLGHPHARFCCNSSAKILWRVWRPEFCVH